MITEAARNMDRLCQLLTPDDFDLHWQMTSCERCALLYILSGIKPDLSLEIGTYKGGSLQVLSKYSNKVISIDIDPSVQLSLQAKFSNVDFYCGDSHKLIPELIKSIDASPFCLDFVLVDGDHSTEGVKRDICALLNYIPKGRCIILLHDSFNPDCRKGILNAPWAESPYVQFVELDFIPGIYHEAAFDTAGPRTMWGGFACAVLEPIHRKGNLVISESQRGLFEAIYRVSSHRKNLVNTVISKIKSYICRLPKRH